MLPAELEVKGVPLHVALLFFRSNKNGLMVMSDSHSRRETKARASAKIRHREASSESSVQRTADFRFEESDDGGVSIKRPSQTIKVIGTLVYCCTCDKEIASYYCSCEYFFCAFDMVTHVCAMTLKRDFAKDLRQALR